MSRKLIGHIGVDSGQMMLSDPCYVTDDSFTDDRSNGLDIGENREGPYPLNYEGACNASMSKDNAGVLGDYGAAVVCATGYGDGSYPVYVEYAEESETNSWGRRVKSMTIEFIDGEETPYD